MAEAMTCDICGKFLIDISERCICKIEPMTYLDINKSIEEIQELEINKDLCYECFEIVGFAVKKILNDIKKQRTKEVKMN